VLYSFKKLSFFSILFFLLFSNYFLKVYASENNPISTKEISEQAELYTSSLSNIGKKKKIPPTLQEDCTTVDLRNQNRLQEVRDQGGVSWCYAHATADLLQYHFQTEKISASDIAIQYNKTFVPFLMKKFINFFAWLRGSDQRFLEHETGFIKIALKKMLNKGYCSKADFPDEYLEKYNFHDGSRELVKYGDAMNDLQVKLLPTVRQSLGANIPYVYKFPLITDNDFVKVLLSEKRKNIYKKFDDLSCGKRVSFDRFNVKQFPVIGNRAIARIDEQLEKNNPVVFDYFSDVLFKPDFKRFKIGALHTSLGMGRRWNVKTNKCEYLIRNSWGPACNRYSSSYTCEEGYIWIPQESMYRASLLATYLD